MTTQPRPPALICICIELRGRMRANRGQGSKGTSATLSVGRGNQSMGWFYATYAAVAGTVVAVDVATDAGAHYRVLWIISDSLIVWYVCVVNQWFRNKIVEMSIRLAERETR